MGDKSQAESLKDLGNEEFKKQNYTKAAIHYTEAINACPEEPTYYSNRSAAFFMSEQFSDSLADSKKALELDPKSVKSHLRAARCYVKLGQFNEAKSHFQKAISYNNEPSPTVIREMNQIDFYERQFSRIDSLLTSGDYANALREISSLEVNCTSWTQLKIAKARALLGIGRYSEASNLTTELIRADNTNVEATLIRGKCQFYTGNVDNAIKHYSQILRMDPDCSEARTLLKNAKLFETKKKEGNEAFVQKKHQEAYDIYSELIDLDVKTTLMSTIYCNRAAAGMMINKLKEALDDCDKAIEIDPNYVKAYRRRGTINMKLENYEDAVRDFEKTYEFDRSDREVKSLLKDAQLELKKSKRKDFYKILGVPKDASDKDIRKAYRALALKYHPDKCTDISKEEAELKFKDIGEAYAILSDENKRRKFDSGADMEDLMGGEHGVDVNEIFRSFSRGPGSGRGGPGFHFSF
eukprot:TRINITY_DN18154_c0_g1_i1.p1 TRINITY_DN18154_c0_g1~~TRINITY_DN18154_c0_g1_i1.p1  ORF type:complete len:490 (-),score=91.99 TRINITY_DN18154_c0_g1_i1:6-1406(-)